MSFKFKKTKKFFGGVDVHDDSERIFLVRKPGIGEFTQFLHIFKPWCSDLSSNDCNLDNLKDKDINQYYSLLAKKKEIAEKTVIVKSGFIRDEHFIVEKEYSLHESSNDRIKEIIVRTIIINKNIGFSFDSENHEKYNNKNLQQKIVYRRSQPDSDIEAGFLSSLKNHFLNGIQKP